MSKLDRVAEIGGEERIVRLGPRNGRYVVYHGNKYYVDSKHRNNWSGEEIEYCKKWRKVFIGKLGGRYVINDRGDKIYI